MATEMRFSLSARENILLLMTLLLAPSFLMMFIGAFRMRRTNSAFLAQEQDMPQPLDFWRSVAWMLAIVVLRFYSTKLLQPLGNMVLAPSKRSNVDRLERFAAVAFKLIFYLTITALGYHVMRHEKWFPPAFGGSGDAAACYDVLETAPSWALKQYYMLQLGYHLHSLVYMVFLSPIRNDFIEMFVHHVATILLIVGSYLANYLAVGALIVFTHDIGDITGYLIKAFVDSGKTKLIIVLYVQLLVSWAYTRLYVFPVYLIRYTFVLAPTVNAQVISHVFLRSMHMMLCMLQVLHVYWYVLFLIMGYTMLTKGKAEDIQQQCKEGADAKRGSTVPIADQAEDAQQEAEDDDDDESNEPASKKDL